jgi:hypothetical protein
MAQERARIDLRVDPIKESSMSRHPGSIKPPTTKPPYGRQPQPQRESENTNDFDASEAEGQIDDPGDAQRSSKSEPDGDGEEG